MTMTSLAAVAKQATRRLLDCQSNSSAEISLPEHDLLAEAGRIAAPTVVIWGRHDPVLSPRVGETARDLIPGSRLVVIDSGHLPHTTNPAAVAAELVRVANAAFGRDVQTDDAQGGRLAKEER
jgi:pimeloyl-ACP methyl ester carboxylesterase